MRRLLLPVAAIARALTVLSVRGGYSGHPASSRRPIRAASVAIAAFLVLPMLWSAVPAGAHHRPGHRGGPAEEAPTLTSTPTATAPATPTATPTSTSGGRWFLHGVNYAWWNYGADFGHAGNGVAANRTTHNARFDQVRANGGKVIRWWLFPASSEGWGTVRLGQAPSAAVYADLDAAVELARAHDLYLHFTFLDGTNVNDLDHVIDAARARAVVDTTFRPILRRYGAEPRILSWDAMNEPDWKLEQATWKVDGFRNYVALLAGAVHAETGQKVTVGAGYPKNRAWYRGLGLDFYTFHRYDWMAPYPDCCDVFAHPASYWGMDRPVVIGEFREDGQNRYEHAWQTGYAGAWTWSLNAERTADGYRVDWSLFRAFAQRHAAEWRVR